MGQRILIMSASVGSGHVQAATSLEKVFKARPEVDEVFHDDALAHTNVMHKQFYSNLYAKLSELAPSFLGWWYENSDDPWLSDSVRLALDLPHTLPLIRFIQEFRPDAIVCTHFMPAGVVSFLLATKKLESRLSVVVTDFHFHAEWITRAFNRYFVAQEEDKVHMEGLGLPGERITVAGIPVDPIFAEPLTREAACEALRLDRDRPVVLVSAGALGVSPAASVVRRLAAMREDFQTVVICGRNEELYNEVRDIAAKVPDRSFLVLGYTKQMRKLMVAADLMLTKPGGMTTAEALASGVPLMLLDPVGGQEERNATKLLEQGAALMCSEVTVLPYKLARLLKDQERLARMSREARAIGFPDSATRVVDAVLADRERPVVISTEESRNLRKTALINRGG